MTLPGTEVKIVDQAPPRFASDDTAAWFVVGLAERGPTTAPQPIRSLAEYVKVFGQRVSFGMLYDALETFFREGGGLAYVTRIVGPAAAKATGKIFDQAGSVDPADVALVATAKHPGPFGNGLNVDVLVSGADFQLKVTHDTDTSISETSPLLADRAAAVSWSASSAWIEVALGASNEDPRAQAISLAGGADDQAGITDTHWTNALALAVAALGPGQVSAPGRTTAAMHTALLAHAAALKRVALIDLADSGAAATLISAVTALRSLSGARYAAAFAPWAVVPGIAPGTTRLVPYSAVQAGLIARSEAQGRGPNVAAAGENGRARYAVGLSQAAFTDADRELLNVGGVSVARVIRDQVRTYAYRTLVNPAVDANWLQLTGSRTVMAVAHRADDVAERFLFSQLDNRGLRIAEFGGELRAICAEFYARSALFGASPDEAFSVDVGPAVNTTATVAAGQLRAVIELRTSPFAERVVVEITKTPTNESL